MSFVNFKNVYVAEPTKDNEFKKDDNVHNEMRTTRLHQAITRILLDAYGKYRKQFDIDGKEPTIPEGVLDAKNDWVADEDKVSHIDRFLEEYEITDVAKDSVVSKEIAEFVRNTFGNKISDCRFKRKLKTYTTSKKYQNVKSMVKKFDRKNAQVWTGIREKSSPHVMRSSCTCAVKKNGRFAQLKKNILMEQTMMAFSSAR